MTQSGQVRRSAPLVLCYHAVSDTWSDELAVTFASIESQLRSLLRKGYEAVSAGDVLWRSGRLLHVTFDDAFRSIPGALDLLASLGVPATVFVRSDLPDLGLPLPVDRPQADPRQMETLRWDELRDLVERGVEMGSHSQTHPFLTQLSDAELRTQLVGSKERLEAELGRRCSFLAYPFGDHDARVRTAARAAGYDAAFALAGPQRSVDLYAVPRVGIYRSDGARRAALKATRLGRELALTRVAVRDRVRRRAGP